MKGDIQGYLIYAPFEQPELVGVSECIVNNDKFNGFLLREASEDNKDFLETFGVSKTPTYLFLRDEGEGRFTNVGMIQGVGTPEQICNAIETVSGPSSGFGLGENFIIRGEGGLV